MHEVDVETFISQLFVIMLLIHYVENSVSSGNGWAKRHLFKRYFLEGYLYTMSHIVLFQRMDVMTTKCLERGAKDTCFKAASGYSTYTLW